MIYQHVEGTGATGSWKRSLVTKTNLHEHIVGRILKELCEKKLLKEIKSANFPTRRVYLLEYLEPSKENLGGTFFESGALDEGLLVALGMICKDFIDKESWIRRRNPNFGANSKDRKGSSKLSKRKQDQEASKLDTQNKDGETHNTIEQPILDEGPRSASFRPTKPKDILVPYPPNYAHYPKAADVLQAVNESGIIKNLKLGEADIQQILTTLEYDGSIERTRNLDGIVELGYRSVKKGWTGRWGPPTWFGPLEPPYVDLLDEGDLGVGLGNALTQTPCGRCPVFRDCRPGGVVSPEGCVYLDKWLEF
jgi:DNA-directed RNA polymerase III subunit RPC6